MNHDILTQASLVSAAPAAFRLLRSADPAAAQERHQVVFIVDDVAGWDTLAAAADPDADVVLLDKGGAGLEAMAAYLDRFAPGSIDAVHLLSHGAAAEVAVGTDRLDAGTLAQHAPQLERIGAALAPDGDFLLYACDAGAGAAGQVLVDGIAALTRADVAASDDATGAATLGGDWTLEVANAGAHLDAAPFDLQSYAGVLAMTGGFINGVKTSFGPLTTVTTGADGNVYMVSTRDEQSNSVVYKWDGNAWSTVTELNAAQQGYKGMRMDIPIAVDANGKIYALTSLYTMNDAFTSAISVAAKLAIFDGTTWTFQTIEEMAPSSPYGANYLLSNASIVIDDSGIVNISYHRGTSEQYDPVYQEHNFFVTNASGSFVATKSDGALKWSYDSMIKTQQLVAGSGGHDYLLQSDPSNGQLILKDYLNGVDVGQQTIAVGAQDVAAASTDANGALKIVTTSAQGKLYMWEYDGTAWSSSQIPVTLANASDTLKVVGGIQPYDGATGQNALVRDDDGTLYMLVREYQWNNPVNTRLLTYRDGHWTEGKTDLYDLNKNGNDAALLAIAPDDKLIVVRPDDQFDTQYIVGKQSDFYNYEPTLTRLYNLSGATEDTYRAITVDELRTNSDAWDRDGTVTGFVVKAVSTGTLLIGADQASATPWAAGTNDTIDATHKAFWKGAADANGSSLSAFTAVALDDFGITSTTPVQLRVDVTPVNDAPTLSQNPDPIVIEQDMVFGPGDAWYGIGLLMGSGYNDVDRNPASAAIIAGNAADPLTEGRWQYSYNGDWQDVGAVSATNALVLATIASNNTTFIRFVPVAGYHGTPGGLTVYAADNTLPGYPWTQGADRVTYDTTTDGAGSPVSSTSATWTATVTPYKYKPVIGGLDHADDQVYRPGSPALALDLGADAAVSDVDNTDFANGMLSVMFAGGAQSGDTLGILVDGHVALSAGMSNGSTISIDGVAIGSVAYVFEAFGMAVTLNADATPARVSTLLQHLSFATTSTTTGMRNVRVTIDDGTGKTSDAAETAINVSDQPTLDIASDLAVLKAGQTAQLTLTFSAAPVGFELADLTVAGGTLDNLQPTADPLKYTATFTPTADVQDLQAAISIGAGKFADAGGQDNAASASPTLIGGDTLAPTVLVTSSAATVKAGDTATITFAFSEAPAGFGDQSVTVHGGQLTDLHATLDPKVWQATFTPAADTASVAGSIDVAAGAFLDAAGNPGKAGNVVTIGGDTQAPAVGAAAIAVSGATGSNGAFKAGDTVTVSWSGETNTDVATVTVDFSGFGGGAAVAATHANGKWTATYQIVDGHLDTAGAAPSITVVDLAGNGTTRASASTWTVDNEAPTVLDAAIEISGGNGAYKIGDTVTASWNPAGNGDVAGASMDFGQFGATAPVAATLVNGKWVASYTIVAADLGAGPYNVKVTATDDAGNTGSAYDGSNPAVDAAAPAVNQITVVGTPAASATTVQFQVKLSELANGVDAGDFEVHTSGGTTAQIVGFSGSGDTYVIEVGNIAGNGSLRLDLKAGGTGIADQAGNPIAGGYTLGAVHTVAFQPTLSISSDTATVKAGETATLTLAFSGAPVGFDTTDLTVTGGAVTNLQQDANDPLKYTATFTPTVDTQDLNASISIEAGKFQDANGLDNLAGTGATVITGDTLAPTLAITTSAPSVKAGETATLTFTFSEAPSGFADGDVAVEGGQLSNLHVTADPKVWQGTFTPTADTASVAGVVKVLANAFMDAAGNGGKASNVVTIGGDTKPPAVTPGAIDVSGASGTNGAFKAGDTVAVAWSGEANTDIGSVTVDFSGFGGGAAVAAAYANGEWTASYQVADGHIDTTGVAPSITVVDLAGNGTTRASASTHAVDNEAPSVLDAAIEIAGTGNTYKIGDTVTASWNPAGNGDVAGASMDFGQFGATAPVAATLVDGKWVASYTIVAADLGTGPYNVKVTATDDAGNTASARDGSNLSVDARAPAVTAVTVVGAPASNATTMQFQVKLSEAVTGVDAADFVLEKTGATVAAIADVSGSGDTWVVTVAGIAGNGSLRLDLKDQGTGIVDGAGNPVAGGYALGAVHTAAFNAAPVIASNGGLDQATVKMAEGRTAVATVLALDADHDALVYGIRGGADAGLFAIDAASGALVFKNAPAWSKAQGATNSYEVEVGVSDGHGGSDSQLITVQVQSDIDGDGIADVDDDDMDNDGRPNSADDAVPNAYGNGHGDGNGDDIPDSQQINVASIATIAAGNPLATLAVPEGYTLGSLGASAAPSSLPRGVKMPLGQLDFTIGNVTPGGTVEMSIYVDASLKVNAYYKQDNNGAWKNIAKSVTTVGTKTKITFDLTDGGLLDSDHLVNGSISDPGGVAFITPQIVSDGGEATAAVKIAENTTQVTTVKAGAVGAVTYAIVGGDDAALFKIDAQTGVLRFVDAPDFESPVDRGDGVGNNTYVVQVQALDDNGSETQTLTVRVTDVDETLPTKETTVDGVTVVTGTQLNADGSTSQVIAIPVVQPGRSDSAGGKEVADIPLAQIGGKAVLGAQLPTGYGLHVVGQQAPSTAGTSLADLIREIQAHTTGGSQDQTTLVDGGTGFLGALDASTPLLVQSVTPTSTNGASGKDAIVLSGLPAASGGVQTALVIDTSGLSGTTQLQLQHVDFAAIIGAAHVTGGDGSQKVWGDSASQYLVLGADDDTLHGGDGDDTVGSEGGNDHIYGDGGNDVVFGGIGDDYIDGGTGTDTVLMTGASRADYSLRVKDGMLVSTALKGTDGIDQIANVEILQFAGPDTTAAGSIGRLYEAMLGRPADTAGREYWVGQHAAGVSMETIAAAIVGSNEALGQQLGDAAYVEQMYQSLLHRTGDTAGMAFWSQQLANGTVTRAGLALQFADSAEKLALPSSSQLDFNHSDVATLVRMYEALFDRAPDETGLNFWIGAHEGGMAMRTLAQGFLASSESAAHYAQLDDAHFVAELYQTALGHGPSAAEANEWAVKLAGGQVTRADVLLGIADSDEMIQLVGTVTTSIATV